MNLNKVKLGHSPLTDTIFLYAHGKDPLLALDKREAQSDVMAVVVAHMMHGCPGGSEKVIAFGEKEYMIRVTPIHTAVDAAAETTMCPHCRDNEMDDGDSAICGACDQRVCTACESKPCPVAGSTCTRRLEATP